MSESYVHRSSDASAPVVIELADGRTVVARRAQPGDEAAIVRLYAGLSSESKYRRFFQPVPRLTSAQLRYLTDLDGGIVWLAFAGDVCIADARVSGYRSRPGTGDLAVVVADDYQHHEIGHHLTRLATRDARARGITHLGVTLLALNSGAARLARRNHISLRFDDGLLAGDVVLPSPRTA
jgi:hypothetical protein